VTVITKNRFPMKPKHQILKAAATEPEKQAVAVSPAGVIRRSTIRFPMSAASLRHISFEKHLDNLLIHVFEHRCR
jgi:hypothetical protein